MDTLKLVGASFVTAGALATAAAYYMTRPEPVPCIMDLNDQSSEVPGTDRARISKLCKDGKLMAYLTEDSRTLYSAFKRGARLSKNGPCLGWKPSPTEPYRWMSYDEVLEKAKNLGAGLIKLDLKPLNSTNIGIYSQNRPEYIIFEQAAFVYSMVVVPLYDTLGEKACNYIINQAEIKVVVCDTNKKVSNLLNRHSETPDLRVAVVMEEPSGEVLNLARTLGVSILTFSDVEKLGKENPHEINPPNPDDLSIICYTSGTTGLPKGALLTHQGVISIASACTRQLEPADVKIRPGDVLISYLPLAHSYETLLETYCYLHGASVGFFQGDVKKLMDDIKELKPTVFPTVPRLLNRFYDKVMAGVNSSIIKKCLFNFALQEKEKELQRNVIRKNSIWDQLMFKKVQEGLGGRCRLIVTGSAPLSPKVLAFLRCCVGCPILEGYGQTECHAIATLQIVGDPSVGNVGPPLVSNHIKLVDVPEMNYSAADNKGEVCIQGPSVFKGYLKDPEKTRESLDEEGWLHTGDIGEWTPFGCLKIIDRKKHIFKLAQGEYIAPEKIENIYIRSTLVAQMYVYGDSLRACLIGIVVPDPEALPKFAREKLHLNLPLKDLVTNPEIKNAILRDLLEVGKKSGLTSLEQVKDVYIYPKLFSVENGLLTPTFKAKRHELKKYFEPQLKEMYSKLS
ncbi:long-chain-fatty-acid--CoA ligase 1-like [Gigantopelta aegis]|uniref:long-chain-fatty-acid--CoA ligase 1-like n=1 Tax=Gigantopelta aegis TaxID=1735272 RepID=UPI001B88DDFD|nr:long-chain-fatty-acid--CoA ligase 1-like [Gigantopelta aegis]XP_041364606.1 long-chain-fatty-acid--CoA ligase 1-like [Gigantopelta aegis]